MSFEEKAFIKREELKEVKIISDHQGNPADFEGEVLADMHRRRAEVDAVLKVPENFKLPKPIEYPKKCPIENWDKLIDIDDYKIDENIFSILRTGVDNKILDISKYPVLENYFRKKGLIYSDKEIVSDGKKFAEAFFQAIVEITKNNKQLNFLLQKIIEQNEKPDIKKLENAFEISHKLKSEKEIYIIGRLFESRMNPSYLEKDFFEKINDIKIFEKVLTMVKDLDKDDYFYINFLTDICEACRNLGNEFFDKILAANEKMRVLRKQPFFEKYIKNGSEGSMFLFIKKNPYFCEALQNFNLEDVGYATEILDKINSMKNRLEEQMSISEFIYFVNLVKKEKNKLQEIEFSSDYAEKNGLKYSKPSEIILFSTQVSVELFSLEILLSNNNESSTKKEVIANYINENMPFMEDLAKDFKIENNLNLNIYTLSLSEIHEKTASLKLLSSKPEFAQFIKNNFEIENLLQLSKVIETILKNRIDPQFEFKMVAERELERTTENNGDKKKIENLFFLSKEHEPRFIYWLVDLHKKTGFDIFKAISYGYTDSKIPAIKKWYENPSDFSQALSLGILGGEMDDQKGEYTSNIYYYNAITNILNDEKFLQFILDNSDLGILEKAIKSNYGIRENDENKSIASWYNDPATFSKAKQLGILGGEISKQTERYMPNLYKYECISHILNDEKFLKFVLDNSDLGILEKSINSNYGISKDGENKSITGWYNDQETFYRAKKLGIFQDKKFGDTFINRYDKLACLGKINQKQLFELEEILNTEISHYFLVENLNKIIQDQKSQSLYLSTFKVLLENGDLDEKSIEGFPVNKENFCDYLGENEALIEIEKDRGLITNPIPWTKEWFLEDKNRFAYLNKDIIQTFKKFGTNIALAILSGTENSEKLSDFYAISVDRITRESERSTVLQLGEIFSLVISKGNFEMLDQLVNSEIPIGETFKNFVSENEISEKGKTILTLLIAREINTVYYAKTENNIKTILKSVYEKLNKYNSVIKLYKKENIPEGLRTSIGMEYEVTSSIAEGYKKRTASDYKKDIEILSCYSGIAKGNDAIHEIATRPTDNPYLLLLEMKLLNDLDFVDLNFEHTFSDTDYERGSRSFHISLGGEYGIKKDGYADFIQNILVAGDLGGINAGKLINQVNRYSNIRAKGSDCDKIFAEKTEVTEFRSLSIDRAEPFERCVTSIFNLNMAKQALDKYISITPEIIEKASLSDFENVEVFKNFCNSHELIKLEINDQKIWDMIFNFVIMQKKILNEIGDHNDNFVENETIAEDFKDQQDKRQNQKRFSSVIKSYELGYDSVQKYMEEIQIDPKVFYEQINPRLVNIFTKIHNLYLKPPTGTIADSVNAKSVFDSTKVVSENGTEYNESDLDAPKRTIFDNLDRGMPIREGRYNIQGSSDKMIVNVIQQEILNLNREMKVILEK